MLQALLIVCYLSSRIKWGTFYTVSSDPDPSKSSAEVWQVLNMNTICRFVF